MVYFPNPDKTVAADRTGPAARWTERINREDRDAAGSRFTLAQLARRRLEFALARFGTHVRSVTVRMTDLNGPRGGVDKHCLVAIRLTSPPRLIVIQDTDVEAEVAIARVAERAARVVARAVHRLTDWRPSNGRS